MQDDESRPEQTSRVTTVNSLNWRHIAIVIVIIALIAGTGGYLLGMRNTQSIPPSQPSPSPTITAQSSISNPLPNPTKAIATPNVKTFASPDLGISFHYDAGYYDSGIVGEAWGDSLIVKQIGNKVYIYNSHGWRDFAPDADKYVQVFSKDSQDTLTEAITKRFLRGYSSKDCYIETYTRPYEPATYQYAEVRVPVGPTHGLATSMEREAKCPPNTVSGNENIYFLMDTNHPNKLLYFKLGQDNYGSGIGTKMRSFGPDRSLTWDETIKFIDKN